MFGLSSKKKDSSGDVKPIVNISRKNVAPSVISADMHLLGNIISDGVLDIDGKIDGNVRCRTATIRPNGLVRGDVVADTIFIHGAVEGLVKARTVCLYANARVTGTIMHESLSIEDGAFVDGNFKRSDNVSIDDEVPIAPRAPKLHSSFVNDNDPETEEERSVLENLRLIS
jgi:cytoskeletal protein CcmA (bactofilin family)